MIHHAQTVLLGAILLMPIGSHAFAPPLEQPWFAKHVVGMEVGPTGAQFGNSDPNDRRYSAKFDGREIVRRAIQAHSEYLVLWARDGDYAYYNSAILPKAPGLLERDPLQEAVEEARPHRLPIIAYCVVQQGGHFLREHPEFEMRSADGKPLGRFCLRSGYLETMKKIVAEQLAYGIDGFHIDMLDQGFGPPYGCWCETCRQQFENEYHRPMPAGSTWDEDWDRMLAFRYASSRVFEIELANHIRQLQPKATVDFNYHGNPPFSFEVGQRPVEHAGNGDFVTGETGVWGFSALTVGLNAEFYRAAFPGKPFQVAMQRGVRMYHDQTTRPLADIRWELLTLLAHGAFVTMVDKTAFDGSLDSVAYDRVGDAFEEALRKREHFGHTPVQEVGIYFSQRTRDGWGRDSPARYFQHFQGVHRALVYHHIPFGILFDESISPAKLLPFRVVVVPQASLLTEREIELFHDYAEQGGHLLFTGQTGCLDRTGKLAPSASWQRLVGAKPLQLNDILDHWIKLDDSSSIPPQPSWKKDLITSIKPDWPIFVKGPAVVYQPTDAIPFGSLMKPFRTTRQQEGKEGADGMNWPMSADSVIGPAGLYRPLGKGKIMTLSCSPDYATASEHATMEARRLLINAIDVLNPKPKLRITAPISVESVITDDSEHRLLRIHLLGYNSPPQTTPATNRPFVLPAPMEDPPIFRVVVQSDQNIEKVQTLDPKTRVDIQKREITATIENVHEVLIIQY
jgi:hypothetical protein